MNISDMFGSHHMSNRRWNPQVEISQNNVGQVPPGDFSIDPYLPTISVDPFDPAAAIVIPSGRFVSIGYGSGRSGGSNFQTRLADTGRTPLTLCDGLNLNPVGMSINQMYKENDNFMTDSNTVKFRKGFVAEVPYVADVNGAYGEVRSGDYLASYWGATASVTNVANLHRGKPVRWVGAQIFSTAGSASATWNLPAAIYAGIRPRIIGLNAAGVPVTTTTQALSYSGSNWVLSLTGTGSATVTEVLYEYGHGLAQVAGQAIRVRSLNEIVEQDTFNRWVQMAPQDSLNFPPLKAAATRYPVTTATQQSANQVTGNTFRVQNFPMSVHHPVTVEISNATLADITTGTTSTYNAGTWFTLPSGTTQDARGFFIGNFHTVNWRTGVIDISSNIAPVTGSAIQVRVTYSYISDPRDGAALWGGGILGLTDGDRLNTLGSTANDGFGVSQPTVPTVGFGVPSYLNLVGVIGALRLFVN